VSTPFFLFFFISFRYLQQVTTTMTMTFTITATPPSPYRPPPPSPNQQGRWRLRLLSSLFPITTITAVLQPAKDYDDDDDDDLHRHRCSPSLLSTIITNLVYLGSMHTRINWCMQDAFEVVWECTPRLHTMVLHVLLWFSPQ
jgi:hypothetical protein